MKAQTVAFKSTPYAGGTNSCFLKPPLRGKHKQLLSKSTPYAGGTNICFLKSPLRWSYRELLSEGILRWRYKQLLCKSTPYAGGTNSCFLKPSLRWRYKHCPIHRPDYGLHCLVLVDETIEWMLISQQYLPRDLARPRSDWNSDARLFSKNKHLQFEKQNCKNKQFEKKDCKNKTKLQKQVIWVTRQK